MSSIVVLDVTILIALLGVVVLLFRLLSTLRKLDSYCDTFEKVIQNAFEEQGQPARDISRKLDTSLDHLKTMSRNIYVMAKVLMGERREEEAYAATSSTSNTGSTAAPTAAARAKESVPAAQEGKD